MDIPFLLLLAGCAGGGREPPHPCPHDGCGVNPVPLSVQPGQLKSGELSDQLGVAWPVTKPLPWGSEGHLAADSPWGTRLLTVEAFGRIGSLHPDPGCLPAAWVADAWLPTWAEPEDLLKPLSKG